MAHMTKRDQRILDLSLDALTVMGDLASGLNIIDDLARTVISETDPIVGGATCFRMERIREIVNNLRQRESTAHGALAQIERAATEVSRNAARAKRVWASLVDAQPAHKVAPVATDPIIIGE